MTQIITPCGDNCSACPKYTAKTDDELKKVAELWYKAGLNDKIAAPDEMRCGGCSSHKTCTYGLTECIKEHNITKCNQCDNFPCHKIEAMLERTKNYEIKCREVCTEDEYEVLKRAFFEKEMNLRKQKS
jgi:hypothetical protein